MEVIVLLQITENDGAKAEKLSGSITAAGSSALKPLVDDAADLLMKNIQM